MITDIDRPRRALAFGAHPDDVEIYCLGLLLRLQAAGWEVGWVVASDGGAGLTPGTSTATRAAEARAAAALVGVEPVLLEWKDGAIDDGSTERTQIRGIIADVSPDIVITHDPADYHPDHRALSRIVHAACPLGTALLYADTMLGVGFLPQFTIDISDVHVRKMACLQAHGSQRDAVAAEAIDTWSRFRSLQQFKRRSGRAESFRIASPYHSAFFHKLFNDLVTTEAPVASVAA